MASVRFVIESIGTPVKFAIQTLAVFVGSQTFCTCTTAMIAATSTSGGSTCAVSIAVKIAMPTPNGIERAAVEHERTRNAEEQDVRDGIAQPAAADERLQRRGELRLVASRRAACRYP